ncbi:MAG: hypothetical protein NVS4B7_11070 [Ktedonobacteraceae bacterium]
MAFEDYLEPEIAVTAVVTAAVFSPQARKLIRRGLVYGTAGVLIAGDAIASMARTVGQGVQQAGASAAQAAQNATQQAQANGASTETGTASTNQPKTVHKPKAATEGAGGPA